MKKSGENPQNCGFLPDFFDGMWITICGRFLYIVRFSKYNKLRNVSVQGDIRDWALRAEKRMFLIH